MTYTVSSGTLNPTQLNSCPSVCQFCSCYFWKPPTRNAFLVCGYGFRISKWNSYITFVIMGPLHCAYRGSCLELYYCNTVEWFWGIQAWSRWPTDFLQCFDTVGLVIWPVKIVSEMTCNVLSGTLSLYTTTTSLYIKVMESWSKEQKTDHRSVNILTFVGHLPAIDDSLITILFSFAWPAAEFFVILFLCIQCLQWLFWQQSIQQMYSIISFVHSLSYVS